MACKTPIELPGCVVSGDTLPAITYTILVDAVPANLLGAAIVIVFKAANGNYLACRTGAGITITNGSNGQFQIDAIPAMPLPPGKYSGDVAITYANGEKYTDVTLILNVV